MARVFAFGKGRQWLLAALVAAALLFGGLILRPWYARLDAFTARTNETSIGAAASHHMAAGDGALVQVRDYGFFAVQAGSGRPWTLHPDRSIDPRKQAARSSFESAEMLKVRLQRGGVPGEQ